MSEPPREDEAGTELPSDPTSAGGGTPPWWPHGEPWPPSGRGRHGHRAWGGRRHGARWRPLGCLLLLFGLFAAGTIVVGLWAIAAIVGMVEAPAIVVAAGLIALTVVVLGALIAARAFRRMTQPLDALIDASSRIESGDYTARVPISGPGELRSLARAFNQMSERLEAAESRRRAYLADVTHELRTPLTVIQGQLESIEEGVYPADEERIASLLAQSRLMASLVEDLHTISLAEVGGLRLDPRSLDLRELLDEVVAAYAPAARSAGVRLGVELGAEPVMATIDVRATRRVLGNLVANALRHTPAGGTVTLSAQGDGEAARVEVADTGEGMDPELMARAFDRFETGPGSSGSGLGLAIARDLVGAQGGSIELRSTPQQGTTVTLTLPGREA